MTFTIDTRRSADPQLDISKVSTDQVMNLRGEWEEFRLIQQGFAKNPSARLFYFDGMIEILMPGQPHETFSHVIGWMLTYFLLSKKIKFTPTGSVTQEHQGKASAEADESYCIGELKPLPDLSIEVIFTSGSVKKLELYKTLGIPEVWFWEDGALDLYHLRDSGYERLQASELPGLEDLDLAMLKRCILIAETSAPNAMMAFVEAIGAL